MPWVRKPPSHLTVRLNLRLRRWAYDHSTPLSAWLVGAAAVGAVLTLLVVAGLLT